MVECKQGLEVIPQSQLYAADDPPIVGDVVAQTIISGLSNPTSLEWTPDGQNMYVTQKNGFVRVLRDGVLESTPFIDITAMVNGTRDRGLLDIAVHPDFENTPYVYLLFTYDPPEVFDNSGLAGPDGNGNRAGRLIRVTADAANDYKTAVAGSEVILLGTNSTWGNFNGFVNSTNNFSEPAVTKKTLRRSRVVHRSWFIFNKVRTATFILSTLMTETLAAGCLNSTAIESLTSLLRKTPRRSFPGVMLDCLPVRKVH